MVSIKKKIALLHRYPYFKIVETNAAFYYLNKKGIEVLTFKKFDRFSNFKKMWKSILWIFYAPMLVFGKGYDVIYCDDSFPFYPALVKLASPKSRVIIRLGDLHLMYYTSGLTYNILHWFEKITWKMVDCIVPISEAMTDYIRAEIGDQYDIRTINDPVEPKFFRTKVKSNHGTVMFHGLITGNKHIDYILECGRRMKDVVFVVIGEGPDRKRLEKLAPPNVIFKGWISFKHIHKQIERCAVGLALRSGNPGNEYVVTSPFLQYGVMGKPCLVTRRKVFGDYEWQFSNVDEMVEKIKFLLKHPEEGEKLQSYVFKNHNAFFVSEKIWEILSA